MPDIAALDTDTASHSDEHLEVTDSSGDDLVEESLVEEVSIDGMCGVY